MIHCMSDYAICCYRVSHACGNIFIRSQQEREREQDHQTLTSKKAPLREGPNGSEQRLEKRLKKSLIVTEMFI